jgi:hypothetical protein
VVVVPVLVPAATIPLLKPFLNSSRLMFPSLLVSSCLNVCSCEPAADVVPVPGAGVAGLPGRGPGCCAINGRLRANPVAIVARM